MAAFALHTNHPKYSFVPVSRPPKHHYVSFIHFVRGFIILSTEALYPILILPFVSLCKPCFSFTFIMKETVPPHFIMPATVYFIIPCSVSFCQIL